MHLGFVTSGLYEGLLAMLWQEGSGLTKGFAVDISVHSFGRLLHVQ